MAFSFSFVDLDGADESFVQAVLEEYNLGTLDKIVVTHLYDNVKFDVYYSSRNEKGQSFCHDLHQATKRQTTLPMKHGYNFVTNEHIVWNIIEM